MIEQKRTIALTLTCGHGEVCPRITFVVEVNGLEATVDRVHSILLHPLAELTHLSQKRFQLVPDQLNLRLFLMDLS